MKNKKNIFIILILLGIFLRLILSTLKPNFDFESYCIVGKIVGNFGNVYAETSRYNYGPLFFCIQGLSYWLANLFPNWISAFRIIIISILTCADLGITAFICKKFGRKKAIIFFLNPVSIIITGYHNQFDNIAVLFALLSIYFYNEEKDFNKKDFLFVLFLSLSLITKHILFIFPFFILIKKELPLKKRALYSFVPPLVFLFSFVPFAIQSKEALSGIINNVFLYKSFNNYPLLNFIEPVSNFLSLDVFVIKMSLIVGLLIRKKNYDTQLFIYFIALVSLSSAIANQYLAIPLASLIILDKKWYKYVYIIPTTIYLLLEKDGLKLFDKFIINKMPNQIISCCEFFINHAYSICAWILFVFLIYNIVNKEKEI